MISNFCVFPVATHNFLTIRPTENKKAAVRRDSRFLQEANYLLYANETLGLRISVLSSPIYPLA